MSARTMLLRVMAWIRPRNMARFEAITGMPSTRLYRALADNDGEATAGMRMETLRRVAKGTGIHIGQLAEWWAEDEGTVPDEVLQFRMPWHRPNASARRPAGAATAEQRP